MSTEKAMSKQHFLLKTALLGSITLCLFAFLLIEQQAIIALTSKGRWLFVVPIGIAFLFSFMHGKFTANFWDLLGIKAKQAKGA
jgi:uncharacterized integral membrane protein